MKLTVSREKLELHRTFRISRSADDYRESLIVTLDDDGLVGLGEAAPMARYGQTADSAEHALAGLPVEALRCSAHIEDALEEAAGRLGSETAALAAIDAALHDLLGKRLGAPLYAILGLNPDRTPVTSYTIGIDTPEIIEEKVAEAGDFPVLKVKMGLENDREILETIRAITGRPLRIDANEGWTRDEALEKITWLAGQNVEFVEQPLPAERLDDSRWLAERSPLPIFADENVSTLEDVPRLAGAFHGINIKLTKCGGIRAALRMIHAARACGLQVMLGCTVESSVGITAAAQISPLADYADLDGNILIRNDPAVGVKTVRGKLILPGAPGLGVSLVQP